MNVGFLCMAGYPSSPVAAAGVGTSLSMEKSCVEPSAKVYFLFYVWCISVPLGGRKTLLPQLTEHPRCWNSHWIPYRVLL